MRFWNCAITECMDAAALDVGACERCRSVYCSAHVKSAQHACKNEALDDEEWLAAQNQELADLSNNTHYAALVRLAKELSGGLDCRIDDQDLLGRRHIGGMHVHLQLLFEDGSIWLARILRENYTSFDDELSNQILLSECATLKWLESVAIPTPRLHAYGLRGDPENEVGVAYMLIDKLPGKPYDPSLATEAQAAKVKGQWADILCELAKHPIHRIGSLYFASNDTIRAGPIASDRTGTLPLIGPFNDAKDFYSSWADSYLDLIANKQLFSEYPIDAYLMFKFLRDKTEYGIWLDAWQELNKGPFFLNHADDKGDHILVNDEYEVTGIIDWSFARSAPAYEAFGPSLMSANTEDLFTGKPGLSSGDKDLERELQSRKAPYIFFDSDKIRRLIFGIGAGLCPSNAEAIELFHGIVTTFEDEIPGWNIWRQRRLVEASEDDRLATL